MTGEKQVRWGGAGLNDAQEMHLHAAKTLCEGALGESLIDHYLWGPKFHLLSAVTMRLI